MPGSTDGLCPRCRRYERDFGPPCGACGGTGVKHYSSGSTWMGGVGVASVKRDICNVCWGSGYADSPFNDLKRMLGEREKLKEEEIQGWFMLRTGLTPDMASSKAAWKELIRVVEKQLGRRKGPSGIDLFWYRRTVETLVRLLKKLGGLDG